MTFHDLSSNDKQNKDNYQASYCHYEWEIEITGKYRNNRKKEIKKRNMIKENTCHLRYNEIKIIL